jgi:hypothetical protein
MNPSSINQVMLNGLSLALQGVDIVDPSTPFTFLLEATATATAVGISKSEILTRKQYPFLAQSLEDLYHHMSDTDYIGIFGYGGTTTITFMVPVNQLINNAVELTPGSNVSTVIIPRDTQINVNGFTVEIGYPIIINVLPGELIQVYYDTSILNPLIQYNTNIIPYTFLTFNGGNYLQFTLPAIQVSSFSTLFTLGETASFYQTISFPNKFCSARVFINNGTNSWVEINTTFSDMVYDINEPTMLLALNTGNLIVTLPDIYQSLNLVSTSIRVDIYTTLGNVTVDLSQVSYNNFSAFWYNFDTLNTANTPAISAFSKINDILISSNSTITGGADPLTFSQVQQRVVYHIDSTKAPIRPSDVTALLTDKGYSSEILINTVTNRMYLASKNLPSNNNNGLSAVPLATNNNVKITLNYFPFNNVNSRSVIVHPSERTTILPTALFSLSNGDANLLTDDQIDTVNSLQGQPLCDFLNSGTYMFTPFTYILDYTTTVLNGRVYYLTKPYVIARQLMLQNNNRPYNIATMSSKIELIDRNYILILTAAIPVSIPSVICQLTYVDVNSASTIFLTSTALVQNNQAIFTFNLETNFDLNSADQIELTNFINGSYFTEPLFVDLTSTFNVFYLIPGSNIGLNTSFDDKFLIPHDILTTGVIGATYETITINFGVTVPDLYCPVYENLAIPVPLTYNVNVLAYYDKDIYQQGPDGPLFTIDNSGEVQLVILHHSGDPVIDPTTMAQKILHYAGAPILDPLTGNVTMVPGTNSISYLFGVTLIDAKLKYSTGVLTSLYFNTLVDELIGYLQNDIAPISKMLNEQTWLWYKPPGESFTVNVSLGNGIVTTVLGLLDIQITIYMNNDGLQNQSLQKQTTNLIREVISEQLNSTTLSKSTLIEAINLILPPQAITLSIDSYLPNNVEIVNILDTTQSFSINTMLKVMPDNTVDIVDSIVVLYKASK